VATFLMMGRYSTEALKGISADRTQKATELVKKQGGEIKSMFALLGEFDLALVVELPGVQEAMKASVALSAMTGIGFRTLPAIPVKDFDKIAGK